MKTVLLIGDSIRLGYQQRVRELLGEDVQLLAPDENCRFTKFALWGMFAWMEGWGNPKIDLIHWNTGIWDLHRATADGQNFSSKEEYVRDNERLCIQMESYCDNLIWATTIPGGPALDRFVASNALINSQANHPKVYLGAPQSEWNADVVCYNNAASRMYRQRGVAINDLYSLLLPDLEQYISQDGCHPTDTGYEVLAQQVAKVIREKL